MSQQIEFDHLMNSVTSELNNINSNFQQRKQSYKKCMKEYKQHLEKQTKQLTDSEQKIDRKNGLIRKQYQSLYDTIHQDSDNMFRFIKNTFKAKADFWTDTIQEFIDSPDLELKKNFYQEKREAIEMQEESNVQRKMSKKVPYSKLVSLGEKNRTLQNYQESNRNLQHNVHAGTLLRMTNPDLLKAIPTERIIFDNKENTINNWSRVSYNKKVEEYSPEGILKNFIRQ